MDDDQPIRGPDGGYADGRRADFNRLGRMLEEEGRRGRGAGRQRDRAPVRDP